MPPVSQMLEAVYCPVVSADSGGFRETGGRTVAGERPAFVFPGVRNPSEILVVLPGVELKFHVQKGLFKNCFFHSFLITER